MISSQAKFARVAAHRGFTLLELLVVLLPVVKPAREAARRMQCQSHLKLSWLAGLNFESSNRRFPSGGWGYQWQGFADVSSRQGQPGSWTYSLLPYLEQAASGNRAGRCPMLPDYWVLLAMSTNRILPV